MDKGRRFDEVDHSHSSGGVVEVGEEKFSVDGDMDEVLNREKLDAFMLVSKVKHLEDDAFEWLHYKNVDQMVAARQERQEIDRRHARTLVNLGSPTDYIQRCIAQGTAHADAHTAGLQREEHVRGGGPSEAAQAQIPTARRGASAQAPTAQRSSLEQLVQEANAAMGSYTDGQPMPTSIQALYDALMPAMAAVTQPTTTPNTSLPRGSASGTDTVKI